MIHLPGMGVITAYAICNTFAHQELQDHAVGNIIFNVI